MSKKTFLVGTLIAGALGIAQVLVDFDPHAIGDWKVWAVSLTGAFIRPAATWVVTNLALPRITR